MDSSLPQPANFEAPSQVPSKNIAPSASKSSESAPSMPEQALNPTSSMQLPAGAQTATAPIAGMPQMGLPLPPSPAVSGQPQPLHPSAPQVADDLDLIEKAWVEKAKDIVAQTRTDPFAQNKEMNVFKADYMKKRYNKDIKIEN